MPCRAAFVFGMFFAPCKLWLSNNAICVTNKRQVPLKEAAMNQGAEVVKGLESRAASSLGLAGDAGEPLLLALALLNAAEVSWLSGRHVYHVFGCVVSANAFFVGLSLLCTRQASPVVYVDHHFFF